ncbi:MAG TPA: hypothetical protein VG711_04610, partial [Phycisphaerales bacterium]|nr:hypothetical protein [Phycisphaerales bacterium]
MKSPAILASFILTSALLAQSRQETTGPKPVYRPGSTTQAPTNNAPDIERFLKIRAPNSPALAADGTLYVRDWPDGIQQLYKRAADAPIDGPMTKLTNFKDGVAGYSLSPDSKHIVIAAAVGGNEQNQLYHFDPGTGDIKPLLQNPSVVYSLQCWLHDSSGFIFTANDESSADFYIYRYDFAGDKITKLLGKSGEWSAADITADGTHLLVSHYTSASKSDAFQLTPAISDLTLLNIAPGDFVNSPFAYLPGEQSVAILSDKDQGIPRLFVRDLTSGNITKPLPDLDPYPIEG